jgi:hypothetical protein
MVRQRWRQRFGRINPATTTATHSARLPAHSLMRACCGVRTNPAAAAAVPMEDAWLLRRAARPLSPTTATDIIPSAQFARERAAAARSTKRDVRISHNQSKVKMTQS